MQSTPSPLSSSARLMRFFGSTPVQLLLLVWLILAFGDETPLVWKQAALALSKSIQEIVRLLLPFLIFGCFLHVIIEQRSKALSFLLVIFGVVSLSNLVSSFIGYGAGLWVVAWVRSLQMEFTPYLDGHSNALNPLWEINPSGYPPFKYLQNWHGLAAAFGILMVSALNKKWVAGIEQLGRVYYAGVMFFLKRVFVPILPLFAFGFLVRMHHEGLLNQLVATCMPLLAVIAIVELGYVLLMYWMAAGGHVGRAVKYLQNNLPAGLVGLTTMSSLAALPVTLQGADKNRPDSALPKAIVGATVNIHMVGSSIVIPILAMYTLMAYGQPLPDLATYAEFAQMFVFYKFTVAAVPGGSILVMLPLLQRVLNFDPNLSTMVVALYSIFNPLVAFANVLTNGAFALMATELFEKLVAKLLSGQALEAIKIESR